MKKIILMTGLMLFSTQALACEDMTGSVNTTLTQPEINDTLKANIVKQVGIKEVKRVEYSKEIPGYFEVFDGHSILYISFDLNYVMSGNLFNTKTKKNLTMAAAFKDKLDWSTLPMDLAIESGDLKSKNKIAVFSDPDCPMCQSFEKELMKVKDLHVYTFLNPLEGIHPESRSKSKVILCSKDKHRTYLDFSINGRQLTGGEDPKACEDKITTLKNLANKLDFHSTPTVVNGAGMIYKGVMPFQSIVGFSKLKE